MWRRMRCLCENKHVNCAAVMMIMYAEWDKQKIHTSYKSQNSELGVYTGPCKMVSFTHAR